MLDMADLCDVFLSFYFMLVVCSAFFFFSFSVCNGADEAQTTNAPRTEQNVALWQALRGLFSPHSEPLVAG